MEYIYTMEYYSATKRMNNDIFSNIDGPRGYHIKWNKTERERHDVISLICGNKKMIWTTLFTK